MIRDPREGGRSFVAVAVLAALLGLAGGAFFVDGVLGLLDPSIGMWDLPPWDRVGIGAVLLAALVALVVGLIVRPRGHRGNGRS